MFNFKSAFRNLKSAILVCAMLFALCFPAWAQQATKVSPDRNCPRSGQSLTSWVFRVSRYFRQALQELGYVERKNILFEYR